MLLSKVARLLVICSTCAVLGCGDGTPVPPPPLPPAEPLTVEAWRDLEPTDKYDPSSWERLKLAYPKLNSEKEWDKFMRDVILPERRIDIPSTPPSS